jgi:hypothetical protein
MTKTSTHILMLKTRVQPGNCGYLAILVVLLMCFAGCGTSLPPELKEPVPAIDIQKAAEARKDHSKTVTESSYGKDGQPVADKQGIHSKVSVYDERGKKISEAFFGIDGKPARDGQGIHKRIWAYDSEGYRTKEEYFGVNDESVADKNGIHCREWKTETSTLETLDNTSNDIEGDSEQ